MIRLILVLLMIAAVGWGGIWLAYNYVHGLFWPFFFGWIFMTWEVIDG